MNLMFEDEWHTPTSRAPHAITTEPTRAMAKTLGNATSHTMRRGHVSGPEFAAAARWRVIMITQFSTYVSNRHPLHLRI